MSFEHFWSFCSTGVVLVIRTSSSFDCSMRCSAGPERTPWTPAARILLAPWARERVDGLDQRPCRVDDVVEDEHALAGDVADDVHDLGDVGRGAPLVDDRQARREPLGDGARPLDAAGVGRDDDEVRDLQLADGVEQDRRREQVVDRHVEEALDLRCVQIHA